MKIKAKNNEKKREIQLNSRRFSVQNSYGNAIDGANWHIEEKKILIKENKIKRMRKKKDEEKKKEKTMAINGSL